MKRLIITLLLLTMAFSFANAQQPFVILSGHVLNQDTGAPVPGQLMFISVDSLNYPGYYNQVITDEAGYYTDQIPYNGGTAQGVINVSTADCNGVMVSASAAFFPGIPEVILDFNICGSSTSGCVAAFNYFPASNDFMTFSFVDESFVLPGANIESWFWDFGDGVTSSEQNPTHTYTEAGLFNVCLYISSNDSSCFASICKPVQAGEVIPGGCDNYFWFYPDSTGANFVFEGWVMNGEADTWNWDFGDGTTASGQTVTHQFADTSLVHNVCLTTTSLLNGEVCTSVSCQEVMIYIPSPCESYFWYYPDSTGTAYTFEGSAMNSQIDSWEWDFGDGTYATGQVVNHIFADPTPFHTVCLTTTGTGSNGEPCTYISCQEVYIYIPTPCESFFWYYPDSTSTNFTFEGYGNSNQIESWTWDFGDGSTATGQVVSHTFPGTNTGYAVCLTTTGNGPDGTSCTYTSCQEVYIYIPGPCESYFWYYPDSTNMGYTFEGGSINNQIDSWVWDFGDGTTATGQVVSHIFADPAAVYNVCLTTTGIDNGEVCTYVSCQDVYIYNPSPCENYFEAYTNDDNTYYFSGHLFSGAPAEYFWDFGDGNTATGQQVTHTFENATAPYNVCLTTIVYNAGTDTCSSTSCQPVFPGGGGSSCIAVMSAIPDSTAYTWYFSDLSQGEHGFRFWDFGDGEQSSEANPVHTYAAPGIYIACLTIGDSLNNCWDQTCQEIFVDIIQPGCQASFIAFPADSIPTSLSYMFINTSTPGYTGQQWSFGDGTASTEANPVHTYASAGVYTACLTIWDSTGYCQSTYCMEVFAGEAVGNSTIGGMVLAGNSFADQGIVWLIGANNYYYAETSIDSAGNYSFGSVPAGTYYIYAMLTPGSGSFFEYLPTYYASSLTWQGATIVTAMESTVCYAINLVPSMNWGQGNAGITGTINWGGTFKSGGTPAANVEIVLFNSTGLPIGYTFSHNDGTFEFNNLPYGEYTIHAEMTGKTTQAAVVVLSEGIATASINFVISATEINALGNEDADSPKLLAGNPYPNPVNEILYMELNSAISGSVIAEIVDLQGRVLINEKISLSGANNRLSIGTSDLGKGIYLIRISSEGYQPLQRKFVK